MVSAQRASLSISVGDFVILIRPVIKGAFELPAGTILKVESDGSKLQLVGETCKLCGMRINVRGVARYDCKKKENL